MSPPASTSRSELTQQPPLVEFLEDSYFVPVPAIWTRGPGDRGWLVGQLLENGGDLGRVRTERNPPGVIFEANLSPHFFIYDGLNELLRQPETAWDARFLWSVAFTFELRLRMTTDFSIPVRPASFMPHPLMDWQFFLVLPQRQLRSFWLTELRVTPWLHHSNGQQECTFAVGKRDDNPAAPCEEVNTSAPPIDALNFRAGDFSTNAFVLAAHAAYVHTNRRYEEVFRLVGGLEWEWHVLGYLPGAIKQMHQEMYGEHILRGELSLGVDPFELVRRMGTLRSRGAEVTPGALLAEVQDVPPASHEGPVRLRLSWEAAVDRLLAPGAGASFVPATRLVSELSWLPRGLAGLGFFVRGSWGRDNLNVLYLRGDTQALHVGLFWRQSFHPAYRFLMDPPGTAGDDINPEGP